METTPIIMMIVAMVTVWGGLAWAMVHLVRHPDETSGDVPYDDAPDAFNVAAEELNEDVHQDHHARRA
ncbi:MAG: methionine/alanine import family NSS transporter small subunit [Micrococcus sp.]|nr:methionine/alanine import family NSS transporter small subunit [Micrococcus sp.]